ncbi:MAG: ExbD/TolR family protein [Sandaracinaceae bacterium]
MAADHDDDVATMAQVKRMVRRKLRKREEPTDQSLNIYPLMDVMTILLVFLIMQFAQESANIVSSDELRIPFSTSTAELQKELAIQIARNEVVVEGASVISLNEGRVNPNDKQGGGNGFLINNLHDVMSGHRDRLKLIASRQPTQPFTGRAMLIVDERTPYRTLIDVVYTLGQAEFSDLRFVVQQEGAEGTSLSTE